MGVIFDYSIYMHACDVIEVDILYSLRISYYIKGIQQLTPDPSTWLALNKLLAII